MKAKARSLGSARVASHGTDLQIRSAPQGQATGTQEHVRDGEHDEKGSAYLSAPARVPGGTGSSAVAALQSEGEAPCPTCYVARDA